MKKNNVKTMDELFEFDIVKLQNILQFKGTPKEPNENLYHALDSYSSVQKRPEILISNCKYIALSCWQEEYIEIINSFIYQETPYDDE